MDFSACGKPRLISELVDSILSDLFACTISVVAAPTVILRWNPQDDDASSYSTQRKSQSVFSEHPADFH